MFACQALYQCLGIYITQAHVCAQASICDQRGGNLFGHADGVDE